MAKAGGMRVADVMKKDVFTCKPDERVDSVLDAMRRRRFRHVPVVDDDGKVVGVLADRDIRNVSFVSEMKGSSLGDLIVADMPIGDIMVPDPVTTTPDEPLVDVLDMMRDRRVGCLPVVEDGRLVGIVTTVDFLKLLRGFLES